MAVRPPATPPMPSFALLTCGVGDRVAKYAGEHVYQIVRKQPAFDKGDYTKALQDGFIATDTALSEGIPPLPPL
jgi:protein phosphatase 2C family protein 2/3